MSIINAKESSSSDVELIDSPLFNVHNAQLQYHDESSDPGGVVRLFSQVEDSDLNLPPVTTELQYGARDTRSCVFAGGADVETLQESDIPDAGNNSVKLPGDVDKIVRQIKTVVLFEGYDEDELIVVANYMFIRAVSSGDVVIALGSLGDAFYVVKSGVFKCEVPSSGGEQQPIRTYNGSGYFGELALINQAPRAATITASTAGELWVLSALRYSWLRKRRAMSNAEQFEGVIKSIPLFRNNLNPSLINRLIDAIEVVNLASGDVICRQGEPGDSMYFIIEGEVEVTINEKLIKIMNKNEFFGERALILDEGRAATCCAVAKSRLAKLPKESFGLLIPDNVIDKIKRHIEISYDNAASHGTACDDVTDDDLSTTSVYMEYFCHDVNR